MCLCARSLVNPSYFTCLPNKTCSEPHFHSVYDTKYKQNLFGSLQSEYMTLFGRDDGKKLAVADSGPLDEAYVGGGS
jgi:hypothetical protein